MSPWYTFVSTSILIDPGLYETAYSYLDDILKLGYPVADTEYLIEANYIQDTKVDWYIDGVLTKTLNMQPGYGGILEYLAFGLGNGPGSNSGVGMYDGNNQIIYRDIKCGTARGAHDIFYDDTTTIPDTVAHGGLYGSVQYGGSFSGSITKADCYKLTTVGGNPALNLVGVCDTGSGESSFQTPLLSGVDSSTWVSVYLTFPASFFTAVNNYLNLTYAAFNGMGDMLIMYSHDYEVGSLNYTDPLQFSYTGTIE